MENAKKFFEEVVKTEEAKVLLAAVEAPKTEEDRIEAYIVIAKKLGVELTTEEINAYFDSIYQPPSEELDDEELSQLAGGRNANCSSSYMQKENCWFSDACDNAWHSYNDYICSSNNENGSKIDTQIDYTNGHGTRYG
jgi:predicted ribosomally synthesized peptide with nif11-like leader